MVLRDNAVSSCYIIGATHNLNRIEHGLHYNHPQTKSNPLLLCDFVVVVGVKIVVTDNWPSKAQQTVGLRLDF